MRVSRYPAILGPTQIILVAIYLHYILTISLLFLLVLCRHVESFNPHCWSEHIPWYLIDHFSWIERIKHRCCCHLLPHTPRTAPKSRGAHLTLTIRAQASLQPKRYWQNDGNDESNHAIKPTIFCLYVGNLHGYTGIYHQHCTADFIGYFMGKPAITMWILWHMSSRLATNNDLVFGLWQFSSG